MDNTIFTPLWDNGPLYSAGEAFPLSTDSILLANFANPKRNSHIADFGCGSGILGLILKNREPSITITNIDLSDKALDAARANMLVNQLESGTEYICGDFQDLKMLLPPSCMDMVICNPPYYSPYRSLSSPDSNRKLARSETACNLFDLFDSAAYHLHSGGKICLVYKPDRLLELIEAMAASHIAIKRLRFVQHSMKHRASLVLVEGRLDGNPGLQIDPVLLLHDADGSMSNEAKEIYHQL